MKYPTSEDEKGFGKRHQQFSQSCQAEKESGVCLVASLGHRKI